MHHFAIVDEVDNILIDEARTPLIISGAPEQAADLYVRFAQLAPQLEPGKTPEGMDPQRKKDFVADFDYEFDEKHKTVAITEQGVAKAEKFLGIDHLYRAENGQLVNHLIQSLKAESLYKRDVDYAVIDGEVKIIDEFTGRILEGRRWSEGLHQAVEAKEGVRDPGGEPDARDDHAPELLPHVRQARRHDGHRPDRGDRVHEDLQAAGRRGPDQPADGPRRTATTRSTRPRTASGARSRARSRSATSAASRCWSARSRSRSPSCCRERLEQARHQAHGAQRQARARRARGRDRRRGRPARRGHHRHQHGRPRRRHQARRQRRAPRPQLELAKLGLKPGDPDYDERYDEVLPAIEERVEDEREQVLEAGGLFICGTERHESRRIDNQLRGRSGRQGDPGESRFFLSAEDDLVRLFAGDRIYRILDRLGPIDEEGDEEPIEAKMLSKQIEKAQRKVEEQNFLIRKRVLEYDDVMNQQREVVYQYRDEVLEGRDMGPVAREQIGEVIGRLVDEYTPGEYVEDWDLDGLLAQLDQIFPVDFGPDELDPSRSTARSSASCSPRTR